MCEMYPVYDVSHRAYSWDEGWAENMYGMCENSEDCEEEAALHRFNGNSNYRKNIPSCKQSFLDLRILDPGGDSCVTPNKL